ncbi:MAG: hypothetical protein Athens041674_864 [Parcubacteria group bacterium Athens0416_74]|nr:MAG: hypothetical protein Athens041674_864 [Parcubacteria group bacterium Athens0416_74]
MADISYHGPEVVRVAGRTQLAFLVPVESSDALAAAIRATNRAIECADFLGRIDVCPSEFQARKRHAKPGVCIYVSVPQEVRDPLRDEVCIVAKRILGKVCEAIAA